MLWAVIQYYFILLLEVFQHPALVAPSAAAVSVGRCVSEHFLTWWHQQVLRAHLGHTPPCPRISRFSEEPWLFISSVLFMWYAVTL